MRFGQVLFPYEITATLQRPPNQNQKVMLCFLTRLVPGLIWWLSGSFVANNTHGFLEARDLVCGLLCCRRVLPKNAI